jgi:hypothetical protein
VSEKSVILYLKNFTWEQAFSLFANKAENVVKSVLLEQIEKFKKHVEAPEA